jgi:type III restriction enzyme
MHRQVNAIAGRLSLRAPQRHSLEILDRITELATLKKGDDPAVALEAIKAAFPTVTDFEREFPSICFALATGVGKTRLMGAFVTYLHLAHGVRNFFVLAPNLTIYSKLIADFTPNTSKYVFKGVAEFSVEPPQVITGDNYDATLLDQLAPCRINIFNISKINSEVRGGRSPRIKRLSEYIGESYFDYLANLDDLVLLMDESHRYRASAGVRAINELKPVLGLELTATPFTESARGPVHFKNVVYRYSLAQAMDDGFVKEPAVVTRKDFNPNGIPSAEIERIKLEDGIRLHENVKVELDTYARESGRPLVKPFVLVIARDTTHAAELDALIKSDAFFDGRYKDRVIQVDSSKTGAEEEAMVERLLRVEKADEPTEIVIHVNMLKEGWDVTNLYTIVPLRAANARTLVEQSIGRGLRLPYGERIGLTPVDRLNIVAHDRFQEIVDDANRPDSPLRVQAVEIPIEELQRRVVTVESYSLLSERLGVAPPAAAAEGQPAPTPPIFATAEERNVAAAAVQAIETLSSNPTDLPGSALLRRPEVQARVAEAVRQSAQQLSLAGMSVDVEQVVATVCSEVAAATIDIPRVLVVPIGKVESGFSAFTLDLSSVRYPPVSEELWIQHLRTHDREILSVGEGGIREQRLEDYVVRGLVDFDDVSYDEQADLLYDLAGQTVRHFLDYLSEDETRKVLQFNQHALCALIHAQMHAHSWEKAEGGYEVKVYQGFTPLKRGVFTASGPVSNYRDEPADKTKIGQMLFGSFTKCLYRVQKFQSDTERRFAVILERDAVRWFKPASGQFQITYRRGPDRPLYVPDFVAETETELLMIETKARKDLDDPEVAAKRQAAEEWCVHASAHASTYGGKPWRYALVPHDVVAENMSLSGLLAR